jgi:hypothetical protein
MSGSVDIGVEFTIGCAFNSGTSDDAERPFVLRLPDWDPYELTHDQVRELRDKLDRALAADSAARAALGGEVAQARKPQRERESRLAPQAPPPAPPPSAARVQISDELLGDMIDTLRAREQGITVTDLAEQIDTARSTVDRAIRILAARKPPEAAQCGTAGVGRRGGRRALLWTHPDNVEAEPEPPREPEPEPEPEPVDPPAAANGREPAPASLRERIYDTLIGSPAGAAGVAAVVKEEIAVVTPELDAMVDEGELSWDGRVYELAGDAEVEEAVGT